jgi:hypothetical protein
MGAEARAKQNAIVALATFAVVVLPVPDLLVWVLWFDKLLEPFLCNDTTLH